MATSQKSKAERWKKMYRKLHNLFLVEDIVNVRDFQRIMDEFNTQIKAMEKALNQAISTNQASIASLASWAAAHIHIVPQSPGGANPSAPPSAPAPQPSPAVASAYVDVIYADPELQARNAELFAEGPGSAPISTGASPQAAAATAESITDVGI